MSASYSLIIQGPILSTGRTGITHASYSPGETAAIVDYDCKESIRELLDRYGNLFQEVVIATWEGEPIESDVVQAWSHCHLLKLTPPTKVYKSRYHPTGEIALTKQFYSLKAGLGALKAVNKKHYVVKVRTDQIPDLNRMLSEHQDASLLDQMNKIFIAYFVSNMVADFYFVAPYHLLMELCDSVLNLLPKYPKMNIVDSSVHLVIPLLYSIQKYGKEKPFTDVIYLKSIQPFWQEGEQRYPTIDLMKDYLAFIEEHFVSFSSELLTTMIWRGDQYHMPEKHQLTHNVARGPNPSYVSMDSINFFLFFSPGRYFKNKGKVHLRAILGSFSWGLMRLLPIYRQWVLRRMSVKRIYF